MRLRQFVFVVEDLEAGKSEMKDILGLETCYSDPVAKDFGLKNAMFPIGGNFFELIAPIDKDTTAERYLERRGGDGGYMMMLQSEDAKADRIRIEAMGIRAIRYEDHEEVIATHFHPKDVPGIILSIDTMYPGTNIYRENSYWEWAGPEYQHYQRDFTSRALAAVELQVSNPLAAAQIWHEVTQAPLLKTNEGAEISLDNGRVRFVPLQDDRGTGPTAIDILPQNRRAILEAANRRGQQLADNVVSLLGVKVNLL